MSDSPFSKEILPDVQPEPLQVQLQATPLILCHPATREKRPAPTWLQPQNWTQDWRCGLTSAENRGTITALVLLAALLLILARMPLAFLATWACTGSLQPGADQHLKILFLWAFYFAATLPPACSSTWGCWDWRDLSGFLLCREGGVAHWWHGGIFQLASGMRERCLVFTLHININVQTGSIYFQNKKDI